MIGNLGMLKEKIIHLTKKMKEPIVHDGYCPFSDEHLYDEMYEDRSTAECEYRENTRVFMGLANKDYVFKRQVELEDEDGIYEKMKQLPYTVAQNSPGMDLLLSYWDDKHQEFPSDVCKEFNENKTLVEIFEDQKVIVTDEDEIKVHLDTREIQEILLKVESDKERLNESVFYYGNWIMCDYVQDKYERSVEIVGVRDKGDCLVGGMEFDISPYEKRGNALVDVVRYSIDFSTDALDNVIYVLNPRRDIINLLEQPSNMRNIIARNEKYAVEAHSVQAIFASKVNFKNICFHWELQWYKQGKKQHQALGDVQWEPKVVKTAERNFQAIKADVNMEWILKRWIVPYWTRWWMLGENMTPSLVMLCEGLYTTNLIQEDKVSFRTSTQLAFSKEKIEIPFHTMYQLVQDIERDNSAKKEKIPYEVIEYKSNTYDEAELYDVARLNEFLSNAKKGKVQMRPTNEWSRVSLVFEKCKLCCEYTDKCSMFYSVAAKAYLCDKCVGLCVVSRKLMPMKYHVDKVRCSQCMRWVTELETRLRICNHCLDNLLYEYVQEIRNRETLKRMGYHFCKRCAMWKHEVSYSVADNCCVWCFQYGMRGFVEVEKHKDE